VSVENVALVRTIYGRSRADLRRIVEDDDLAERFSKFCTADFEFGLAEPTEATGVGGTYQGVDGMRKAFSLWLGGWESYTNEPVELIDAGDKVLALTIERGVNRTLGTELSREAASVWTIESGKVKRLESFLTREPAYAAAGLDPP
jgi:ketosteroid isomerase-like protein